MIDVKIYILTAGDKDRINRIKEIFKETRFEFINSIPMPELIRLEKKYKSASHRFRQKAIMAGEIGAFNTHAKAWDAISKSDLPGIIIEDNAEFFDKPEILITKELIDSINDYGIISFTDLSYKLYPKTPFMISEIKEKKPLPIICYGITPNRALDLLGAMQKTKYVVPVDRWLAIPKLCRCYCFVSHTRIARRANKNIVPSIANKKKGVKTFNPINWIFWLINRIKYKF